MFKGNVDRYFPRNLSFDMVPHAYRIGWLMGIEIEMETACC